MTLLLTSDNLWTCYEQVKKFNRNLSTCVLQAKNWFLLIKKKYLRFDIILKLKTIHGRTQPNADTRNWQSHSEQQLKSHPRSYYWLSFWVYSYFLMSKSLVRVPLVSVRHCYKLVHLLKNKIKFGQLKNCLPKLFIFTNL